MFLSSSKSKKKSFTLIELLVVIGIIGLLAAIVLVSMRSAKLKSTDAQLVNNVVQIETIIEQKKIDTRSYDVGSRCVAWDTWPVVGGLVRISERCHNTDSGGWGNPDPLHPDIYRKKMAEIAKTVFKQQTGFEISSDPAGYVVAVRLKSNLRWVFCKDSTGFAGKIYCPIENSLPNYQNDGQCLDPTPDCTRNDQECSINPVNPCPPL